MFILHSNDTDEAGTLHVRTVATTNDMWTIPEGEKIVLEFNTDWQPTGTSGLKFRRLAGQYIRSGKFVTIREKNWKLIPRQQKEDLWAALMVCAVNNILNIPCAA
jgi:hypothetical protein